MTSEFCLISNDLFPSSFQTTTVPSSNPPANLHPHTCNGLFDDEDSTFIHSTYVPFHPPKFSVRSAIIRVQDELFVPLTERSRVTAAQHQSSSSAQSARQFGFERMKTATMNAAVSVGFVTSLLVTSWTILIHSKRGRRFHSLKKSPN